MANENESELIKSMNRYIETLEARDAERVERITELEKRCQEYREHLQELAAQLSACQAQNKTPSAGNRERNMEAG